MVIRSKMKWAVVGGLVWFAAACMESKSKVHVVFIDYTQSASVFKHDNPSRIGSLLQELAGTMEPDDVLEVYPIHAYTESATPVLRLKGPPLIGDLRDRQRRIEWKGTAVAEAIDRIWKMGFSKDRTGSTNIYPVIRKISALMKPGNEVRAYLICDMIQDYDGEDFNNLLRGRTGSDPAAFARRKVSESGFMDVLRGVEVHVMIPGSPHGNQMYDKIRAPVNEFWKSFFTRCGASVVIGNL